MSTQNHTGSKPDPTQKPVFFVLNPEAKLTDLLEESGILIGLVQSLSRLAIGLAPEEIQKSARPGAFVALLEAITTSGNQLEAIFNRFQEVEHEAAQKTRSLSDDERRRFMESIQRRSKLVMLPDSVTDPKEKHHRANTRITMLEGVVEACDLLNSFGIHVPADIASIAESEMGRVAE